MAMINCSECGKEVSDKAETCINCGNPLKEDNELGLVIVKHKLASGMLGSVKAVLVEVGGKEVLTTVRGNMSETFKITEDKEVFAKQGVKMGGKSKDTITIKADRINRVLITYTGVFNRMSVSLVDFFID